MGATGIEDKLQEVTFFLIFSTKPLVNCNNNNFAGCTGNDRVVVGGGNPFVDVDWRQGGDGDQHCPFLSSHHGTDANDCRTGTNL